MAVNNSSVRVEFRIQTAGIRAVYLMFEMLAIGLLRSALRIR
jgi:hypothetical protein